eukprot:6183071-Pleurochrysis_carterae.AAC.2
MGADRAGWHRPHRRHHWQCAQHPHRRQSARRQHSRSAHHPGSLLAPFPLPLHTSVPPTLPLARLDSACALLRQHCNKKRLPAVGNRLIQPDTAPAAGGAAAAVAAATLKLRRAKRTA